MARISSRVPQVTASSPRGVPFKRKISHLKRQEVKKVWWKLTASDLSGQQNPSAEKITRDLKSWNFFRITSAPAVNITS